MTCRASAPPLVSFPPGVWYRITAFLGKWVPAPPSLPNLGWPVNRRSSIEPTRSLPCEHASLCSTSIFSISIRSKEPLTSHGSRLIVAAGEHTPCAHASRFSQCVAWSTRIQYDTQLLRLKLIKQRHHRWPIFGKSILTPEPPHACFYQCCKTRVDCHLQIMECLLS